MIRIGILNTAHGHAHSYTHLSPSFALHRVPRFRPRATPSRKGTDGRGGPCADRTSGNTSLNSCVCWCSRLWLRWWWS